MIDSIQDVTGGHKVNFKWTLDDGTVKTNYIIVKDGVDGTDGTDGTDGAKGDKGDKGDKGVGITAITKQSTSGLIDTYVITFDDDTQTTYNVTNGANITKTSQLTNDSNFIDAATVALTNYYLKDEAYSKSAIDELLRNVGAGLSIKIVATLPVTEISGTTIYLINTTGSQYNQYMYIDGSWANLGSTSADLSSYYNKTQVDNMLLGYVSASALMSQFLYYTKTSDLAKVAKTNDYNDLDNLPTIPEVTSLIDDTTSASNKVYSSNKVTELVNGISPTWSGTHAEWEALSTTERAKYTAVYFTDDIDDVLIDDTQSATDKVYSSNKIESLMSDYVKIVEIVSGSTSFKSQSITSVSLTINDIDGYKPIYISYMYTENYGNILPSRCSNIITTERTSNLNMYNFGSSAVTSKVHATVMYIKD